MEDIIAALACLEGISIQHNQQYEGFCGKIYFYYYLIDIS